MGEPKQDIIIKKEEGMSSYICGEYKMTVEEEDFFGPTLRIYKEEELIIFGEHQGPIAKNEFLWHPNPELSKESLVQIVVEEGMRLKNLLHERLWQDMDIPASITIYWDGKDSENDFLNEPVPDFKTDDAQEAFEKIKSHEKYNDFSILWISHYATSIGMRQFKGAWSHENGEMAVMTQEPQFDWLLDFFYKTSRFTRQVDAGAIQKLLTYKK